MNKPAANTSEQALTATLKSGCSWFYWIAGGSLVNSVIAMTKGSISLIVGLGVTQAVDGILQQISKDGTMSATVAQVVSFVIALFIASVFVVFGILGNKKQTWAIIVGMALYAVDGLIFLLVQDWLSIAFHGFALYNIFRALQSAQALNKMPPPSPPGPQQIVT